MRIHVELDREEDLILFNLELLTQKREDSERGETKMYIQRAE